MGPLKTHPAARLSIGEKAPQTAIADQWSALALLRPTKQSRMGRFELACSVSHGAS